MNKNVKGRVNKLVCLALISLLLGGCYTVIKSVKAKKMINNIEKTQVVTKKILKQIDELFVEYDETKSSVLKIKNRIYGDTETWRGLDDITKESLIKLWTIAVRIDSKVEEKRKVYPLLKEKAEEGYDVLEQTQQFLQAFTKEKIDYNQVSLSVAQILLNLATKK